ncbi:universal stress protein (plasmid) [Deinococcus sp. KNUC1210]|uniref:universal stress protein n=1 Tax=Deinococcus sp. KNUC1210 TaxID=2917691 RepID=UPI001EEFEFF2|nr:universal stress protein [Deinococcus sp. KNUC1210]ULH13850.1 universal stress protein [Deinococcus sp. KNUC1210]
MMFERILVTTDGSTLGNLALPVAADLARTCQSALTVLYVKPPLISRSTYGDAAIFAEDVQTLQTQIDAEASHVLETARQLLGLPEVQTEQRTADGLSVGREILRAAADLGADLIVMSTHGRGGLAHLFLGSVAEEVMRRATVPVLVIRGPGADAATGAPAATAHAG